MSLPLRDEGARAAVAAPAAAPRAGVHVQLIELRRAFGAVRALDDLSLELAPGELVALLGPSGCGKTTALRSLAGLERLDSGRVLLDGRDITHMPASRRDMGMVFQAYSLFPHLTARENVAFGLRLRRRARVERLRTADRLLDLVHLAAQGDRYPHELSGGQQQRVALARALAIEPQVLLLDEPLSALDAKVRGTLRDEIRRIQTEVGITTVFVTHDQDEALAIADRVAVIFAGRLEQIAPPAELYERPRSARVADFVGLSNRIRGAAERGTALVLGARLPLLAGSTMDGPVTVLVRPEAIDLRADAAGPDRVVAASFLGSIARVQVRLADGTLVLAQVPSAEVAHFHHGDAVRVGLRPTPALAITA
jgi:putative spermidine/putrescine transport system ATP-binding protein